MATAVDIELDVEFNQASFGVIALLALARWANDASCPLRKRNPALDLPKRPIRSLNVIIGTTEHQVTIADTRLNLDAPFTSTERGVELCLYPRHRQQGGAATAKYFFPYSAIDTLDGASSIKGYKYTL